MKKTEFISVRISEEDKAALEKRAAEVLDGNVGIIVRYAIHLYLASQRKQRHTMSDRRVA